MVDRGFFLKNVEVFLNTERSQEFGESIEWLLTGEDQKSNREGEMRQAVRQDNLTRAAAHYRRFARRHLQRFLSRQKQENPSSYGSTGFLPILKMR